MKDKDVEVQFLRITGIVLFIVLLLFFLEGCVRTSITLRNNAESKEFRYKATGEWFEPVLCENVQVGYLLTTQVTNDSDTLGVRENEQIVSTCNIVTCETKECMQEYVREWFTERVSLNNLNNITKSQQLYRDGYLCYILADTKYQAGNKTYKVPYWGIYVINPVDKLEDGTFTNVCITTLCTKVGTYLPQVQKSVLNDFFALYNLDYEIDDFMSITDNGVTYTPAAQFAYTAEEYFEFDSTTGTIIEYRAQDKGAPMEVYIPETIYGTQVKAIASNAFYKYNTSHEIKSVIMPDSIISIGDKAFCGCATLDTVKLSANLEYLGEEAFAGCSSLKTVVLPKTLKTLSAKTFYGCSALKNVVGLEYIEELYENTFEKCEQLTVKKPEKAIIHT